MKKQLAAIFCLVASGIVWAGGYGEAAAIESLCSSVGELTSETFKSRKSGQSKEDAIAQLEKFTGENPTKMQKAPLVIAYTINTNARDAYLQGWAYCMDHAKALIASESDSKNAKRDDSSRKNTAAEVDKYCENTATYMVAAYDRRKSAEYLKEIKQILKKDASSNDDEMSANQKKIYRVTVIYALSKATSREDAFTNTFVTCMKMEK